MIGRLLACLLFAAAAHSAEADGPYLLRGAEGWEAVSIAVVEGVAQRKSEPVAAAKITVPGVGDQPSFDVELRGPAAVARDVIKAPGALFVVADTHGEFEILATMLRRQGVVDSKLGWKFGRGHLVVLGDVFDRGPNHLEILWLLYQLEAEAAKAGGGVHLLLGNHEFMVMRGDVRYLNRKYVDTMRTLGIRSYAELFGTDSLLGQWLRTRPVMLNVNDLLCLHGGVSRALVDTGMSLPEINATMRALLLPSPPGNRAELQRAELLLGSLGPLWYRGYFPQHTDYPAASDEDVEASLEAFGARRILVGHTIVPTITPLYDGKVIAVQVYPKRDDSGKAILESLLVKGGVLWRATPDGRLERLAMPRGR
jgi:hypothetical protein